MEKKYELLKDEPVRFNGKTRYRIRALCDITTDVKKGDLGGYIGSEANLSQQGKCWVYPDAVVEENACVSCNAKVTGKSFVSGYVKVSGDAVVENSILQDYVTVCGDTHVSNSVVKIDISKNGRCTAKVRQITEVYEEVVRGKAKRS